MISWSCHSGARNIAALKATRHNLGPGNSHRNDKSYRRIKGLVDAENTCWRDMIWPCGTQFCNFSNGTDEVTSLPLERIQTDKKRKPLERTKNNPVRSKLINNVRRSIFFATFTQKPFQSGFKTQEDWMTDLCTKIWTLSFDGRNDKMSRMATPKPASAFPESSLVKFPPEEIIKCAGFIIKAGMQRVILERVIRCILQMETALEP